MIASVLVDVKAKAVDKTFDYLIPAHLEGVIEIGQRVKVPFGNRIIMGYVLGLKSSSSFKTLKPIYAILDLIPSLTKELVSLGEEITLNNICPLVSMYQAMLPSALKSKYYKDFIVLDETALSSELKPLVKEGVLYANKSLDQHQNELKRLLQKGAIKPNYKMKSVATKNYDKYILLLDDSIPLRGAKQQACIDLLKDDNKMLKSVLVNEYKIGTSTLNSLIKKGAIKEIKEESYRDIETIYEVNDKKVTLTDSQEAVYQEIKNGFNTEKTYLLHGVTSSGKTEIYLRLIEDVVNNGKEAILLVPEISITPMMVARFRGVFEDKVAVLHSGLSIGEKYDEWRKIRRKEVSVVIGARSAIFAPFENLGIIILDEEHSDTYKQDTSPMYHAKDVALLRSKHYQIPLLLGSATPSIESFYLAKKGDYKLLSLPNRANDIEMPHVHKIDMREEFKSGNRTIFSNLLKTLIEDRLSKKEQVMLLLNRRGHSTFVMCRSCGEVIMCPNCDISLTYHERNNHLKCHYCGFEKHNVKECPTCHSPHIRYMGMGTEKVEEIVRETFPMATVFRMDKDTTSRKNAHEKILYDFEHHGDILIGTQMIAKGLDFPSVTLVGILAADMSLNLPDYKAIEKTFALLTQVAGRAGRRNVLGEVVIQTYNPDHYAIKHAETHDYLAFYNEEINIRSLAGYSPVKKLAQIIVTDKEVKKVLKTGQKIVMKLKDNLPSNVVILGPVLPKIARINNIYRAQIIIKHDNDFDLHTILTNIYQTYIDEVNIAIDYHPTLL